MKSLQTPSKKPSRQPRVVKRLATTMMKMTKTSLKRTNGCRLKIAGIRVPMVEALQLWLPSRLPQAAGAVLAVVSNGANRSSSVQFARSHDQAMRSRQLQPKQVRTRASKMPCPPSLARVPAKLRPPLLSDSPPLQHQSALVLDLALPRAPVLSLPRHRLSPVEAPSSVEVQLLQAVAVSFQVQLLQAVVGCFQVALPILLRPLVHHHNHHRQQFVQVWLRAQSRDHLRRLQSQTHLHHPQRKEVSEASVEGNGVAGKVQVHHSTWQEHHRCRA
mmetsp:Transcript_35701/g.64741  ORF Transcript_35701/g.64741 Transcript_35701/m.64741 type:complete len:274 (-) Transcript_35701:849-1670(-)